MKRTIQSLTLVGLANLINPQPAHAHDEFVRSVFGVGFGLGNTSAHGDFIQEQTRTYFASTLELESSWYFNFSGGSSTEPMPNNTFKSLTLMAGASWQRLILGLGFHGVQTVGPTTANIHFPLVHVDTDRDTAFSVSGAGLFVRVRPFMTYHLTVQIDGFYAATTRGSMNIPVSVAGIPGYLNSEPQHQGGLYCYEVAVLWRLPAERYPLALKLSYQFSHATMRPTTSGYVDDPFGFFGSATTPALTFENNSTLLSVVWVTR